MKRQNAFCISVAVTMTPNTRRHVYSIKCYFRKLCHYRSPYRVVLHWFREACTSSRRKWSCLHSGDIAFSVGFRLSLHYTAAKKVMVLHPAVLLLNVTTIKWGLPPLLVRCTQVRWEEPASRRAILLPPDISLLTGRQHGCADILTAQLNADDALDFSQDQVVWNATARLVVVNDLWLFTNLL